MRIPSLPPKVRKELKEASIRDVEWEFYQDDKWFGYANFGADQQRIAITVALVTGKACVEILAPIYNEDILL